MAGLIEYREQKNLTQEELAEKSGLSVRTIQRVEAGTIPKGHTLRALSKALEVEESELLKSDEESTSLNIPLIKLINLSSLLFFIPLGNIWIPLLIMYKKNEVNALTKQIVSLQIFWSISSAILFLLSPFIKKWIGLPNAFVLVVLMFCILVNLFLIIRNTMELDQKQKLCIGLNFSFL